MGAGLALPIFIEVPKPGQENKRSCICVIGISILPLSVILMFVFENCFDSVIF